MEWLFTLERVQQYAYTKKHIKNVLSIIIIKLDRINFHRKVLSSGKTGCMYLRSRRQPHSTYFFSLHVFKKNGTFKIN